jgi:AcrR family transcriptional regulator
MIDAALRLINERGENWTTHDLAKEAGVALQTFYRHFGGKDQLCLAVLEHLTASSSAEYFASAGQISDPLERLRCYIHAVFANLDDPSLTEGIRFRVAQHWRLHELFPEELAQATQPFADLLAIEIERAQESGLVPAVDTAQMSTLMMRFVMVEFHHYAFAEAESDLDDIAEQVWAFCLSGLGPAVPVSASGPRRSSRRS